MEDNFNFDKPYQTNRQLIEILKSRNLIINNDNLAIDLLNLHGYYPLINGYSKPFLKPNNPKLYQDGASIEDIYSLYLIDSQIQEIFLSNVLKVEKHLANTIGNQVAKHFGVDNNSNNSKSYLKANNYITNNRNSVVHFIHNKVIPTHDNPTAYYRKHKNHIPPWILTQNMMFGTLIRYYKIQQEEIKSSIVNELILPVHTVPNGNEDMDIKKAMFQFSLEILSQFRNISAHSKPVYMFQSHVDNLPSTSALEIYLGNDIFSGCTKDKISLEKKGLYGALLCLLILTCDPSQRIYILNKLELIEKSYLDESNHNAKMANNYRLYLKAANLPIDYLDKLSKANNYINSSKNYVTSTFDGKTMNFTLHFYAPPARSGEMKNVFVTQEENIYHFNTECPQLINKEITTFTLLSAKAENMKPCEYCCNKDLEN